VLLYYSGNWAAVCASSALYARQDSFPPWCVCNIVHKVGFRVAQPESPFTAFLLLRVLIRIWFCSEMQRFKGIARESVFRLQLKPFGNMNLLQQTGHHINKELYV
jgi:hypothetical protein